MISDIFSVDSYDPSMVSPGWYKPADEEQMEDASETEKLKGVSSSRFHPASLSRSSKPSHVNQDQPPSEMSGEKYNIHIEPCDDYQYIRNEVFPTLLLGIKELLANVKSKRILDRKRSSFNACDFLTEFLYNNNERHADRRSAIDLWDIPFVRKINEANPRPPLPLSLQWSEEEAALVLQSSWRGYKARCDPDVQELRQYQKEMREEAYDINFKIEEFWKQHPVDTDSQVDEIDN